MNETEKKWRKWAVNKFVYFRWSTAHNSKNRYKGIVTSHKTEDQVDLLTIKTFGFSEDEYVMGKDIREFFVLPKKSVLMKISCDDDARAWALKKWSHRTGWTSAPFERSEKLAKRENQPNDASHQACEQERQRRDEQIQADIAKTELFIDTSMRSASTSASSSPRKHKRTSSVPLDKREDIREGIHIVTRHGRNTMAARVGFVFGNNIFN